MKLKYPNEICRERRNRPASSLLYGAVFVTAGQIASSIAKHE
jgi:hypothetical protein